jgi:hypothetical protein
MRHRSRIAAVTAAVLVAGAVAGPARAAEGPSRSRAILYSLLVPGAGHWYLGRTSRAQIFGAAEAGVWTAFVTFNVQGKLRKDDYVEMAEVFAGVENADGRSDQYYRNLGLYVSSDEYNEIEIEMYARYRFTDPEERAAYIRENSITGDAAWEWTSEEWWDAYRERRSDSQGAYQNAQYALAVGILNRLLSAVDAARIAHGMKRDRAEAPPAGGAETPALSFVMTSGGVPCAALTARF